MTPAAQDAVIAGRYEIMSECGEGGTSSVYKVFDRSLGRVLALKLLSSDHSVGGPGFTWQFKQEFMLTSRLKHPHIVSVYDFGVTDEGRHYFTMDYVEGQPITQWCAKRDVDSVLALLFQVVIALAYIHKNRVVHGDIKPSNIIVRKSPPSKSELPLSGSDLYEPGFAVLMDFGMSRALAEPSLKLSGTVEYMAPERFVASSVDTRSDLYSLGVVFYELIAGRLPFEADTIEGYVEHHLKTTPEPLSSVAPDTPPLLVEVIDSLLSKRPSRRLASATALAARLAEVLRDRIPETFSVSPDLAPRQLFGRDDASKDVLGNVLGRLSPESREMLLGDVAPFTQRAPADAITVCLALGAAGTGRSAFVDFLKSELQLCDLTVMVSPSGAQSLDVSRFLSSTLSSAGLSFQGCEGDEPSSGEVYLSPSRGGDWSGAAKAELLSRFAKSTAEAWQSRHLVWLVDDFDLLDERSREAIFFLLRYASAVGAGKNVALVLAGALGSEQVLDELLDDIALVTTELAPLDDGHIASWLDAAFLPNSFSEAAAPILREKTGGLPVLLAQCMESLLSQEIIHFSASSGGWEARWPQLEAFSAPSNLSSLVQTRLSRLSPNAMSVLVKAAVLAEPFAPLFLASFGGMSDSATHEGIDELVRHGLLVMTKVAGKGSYYAMSNPVLAEVVVDRLSEEEMRAIHRLIAQSCEQFATRLEAPEKWGAPSVGNIPPGEPAQFRATCAIHAAQAGIDDMLCRNYEAAYSFLQNRFKFEEARSISSKMCLVISGEDANRDLRQRILMRLGYLNFVLGDLDQAIKALEERISDTAEEDDALGQEVEATCRLGLIYSGRGMIKKARSLYEALIERLQRLIQGKPSARRKHLESHLARLNTFLGQTFFGESDYESAEKHFEQALSLVPERALQALESEACGKAADPGVLADAEYVPRLCRNQATIANQAARFEEAKQLAEKGIRASRLLHDLAEGARCLVAYGKACHQLKDYDAAEASYREALEYFTTEGFKEGQLVVRNNLATVLDLRGKLKEASVQLTKLLPLADRLGNKYSQAFTLRNLGFVLCQQGWLAEAKERLEESLVVCRENGFWTISALCQMDKASILLLEDDVKGARAAVKDVQSFSENVDSNVRLLVNLLEASVYNAEEDYSNASLLASEVLEKSEQLSRSGLVRALRVKATAASGLGQLDAALKDLAEGLSVARDASTPLEEALCLSLSSRVKEEAGDYDAAIEDARAAIEMLKDMEAFLTLGRLAERLSSLLLKTGNRSEALRNLELARDQFAGLEMTEEAARIDDRIEALLWGKGDDDERGSLAAKALYKVSKLFDSLLDLDELLNCVMDAVIEILDAERGLIMLKDPQTGALQTRVARKVDKQTIEDVTRISKSVIQRVVDLGKPIVTTDAKSDPRFHESKSVSLYDIRSIVCVPLVINGEVAGTVYVDSSLSATIFTKQDLYLLSAFATQATLAIEKAMLLEELQRSKDALQVENVELREAIAPRLAFDNIVGESKSMQDVFRKIEQVINTDVDVLIEGESGTGKELVARAIHFNGSRRDKPFVKINCAAIPESLMENELFGHEKGAFTGADTRKIGKFEAADEGSLFLDEIGDLPLNLQAKLLTAIENKEFQRVGGTQTVHVDVRVLTATNKDLVKLVSRGTFRQDLYYRVNEMPIRLQPLRNRKEDIPHLVHHFIQKYRGELASEVTSIEEDALSVLVEYDWPGNIRELENAIKRALIDSDGRVLRKESLGFLPVRGPQVASSPREKAAELIDDLAGEGVELGEMLEIVEEQILRRAVELEGWSMRKMAQNLQISRNTLKNKLSVYNIKMPGGQTDEHK